MELVGQIREFTLSQQMDAKGSIKRSMQGGYLVKLDLLAGDKIQDAPECGGIPAFGSIFAGFTPVLWCSKKTPKRNKDSSSLIEVEVEFTESPVEDPADPESWAPLWLGSSVEKLPVVAYKDFDGEAIRMTNDELYSDPVQYYINILVTKYRKYCSIPTADATILAHNGRISSSSYRGDPKWTWICTVSASPTKVNDYPVAELQYELRRNPLTWIEERLQHGSYYLDDDEQVLFRTNGPDRAPCTGDLDDEGGKLAAGDPKVYKKYRVNGELNFNVLGF